MNGTRSVMVEEPRRLASREARSSPAVGTFQAAAISPGYLERYFVRRMGLVEDDTPAEKVRQRFEHPS